MPRKIKPNKTEEAKKSFTTSLKVGDMVMVTVGGNSLSGKKLKGQTGKILRFIAKKNRVVVEGLNLIKRHKRAMMSNQTSGIITKEGSVHISNVMFYSEEFKRPFRLTNKILDDGRKVRGFRHPKTKEFQQIDA